MTPAKSSSVRFRRHTCYALVLSFVMLASQTSGVMLPLFRNHLQTYLAIGDATYGLLLSLGSFSGAAGVLAGGALSVRFGPVRVIRYSLLTMAIAMTLIAACGANRLPVLAGVLIAGGAAGPLNVAGSAYLARLFPGEIRRILAMNMAVMSGGVMIMLLVGEMALKMAASVGNAGFGMLFTSLYSVLAIGLALAAPIYKNPRGLKPRGAARTESFVSSLAVPKATALLVAMAALHVAADNAIFNWMPRFLTSRAFSAIRFQPGTILSGVALSYLASRSLLMLIPSARGKRPLLILPGILGGSCLTLAILTRNSTLVPISYVLASLLWSVEYPSALSVMAGLDRKRFAAAMALSQTLGGIGTFLLTSAIGVTVERVGEQRMWQPMAAAAGVFILVGLIGFAWTRRFSQRSSDAVSPRRQVHGASEDS